jgi:hypothetical protein
MHCYEISIIFRLIPSRFQSPPRIVISSAGLVHRYSMLETSIAGLRARASACSLLA